MSSRALAPIALALIGLAGSLAATLSLHRAASGALDRVLEERLRGAGETAAQLIGDRPPTAERLRAIMDANRLDGAYVLSPSMKVVADATGSSGARADLLRVDAGRVERALSGEITIAPAYRIGDVSVETAYFPVRAPRGEVGAVLALEVGEAFSGARASLGRALGLGVALSAMSALALAVAAARWSRTERQRRESAERAARGEAVTHMAATVAHEIRNPLGIIRAAAELLREGAGDALGSRERARLDDVLGEVERLRRLTQDFLDLSADPPLDRTPLDLAEVAGEAARGSAALHPGLEVRVALDRVPEVRADAGRIRQVLENLLANAAQAGARSVEISGEAGRREVRLVVKDDGPGIDAKLRERLFDPFATGREGGTGLGLALSRRIVERHGGSLALAAAGSGAAFEIRLPLRA